MDSITHLALGAVTGEVLLAKRIGKKALLIGALAQSFPDIDFITAAWMSPAESFMAHRGLTHSLLFILVTSVLFALLAFRLAKDRTVNWKTWFQFFLLQQGIHLSIDLFNAYSVGLLMPFSAERFTLNTLFVADPLFTFWLVVAGVILAIKNKEWMDRKRIAIIAIAISSAYLTYASVNKIIVNARVKSKLVEQVQFQRYFTTPTPFNSWLYYIVAEDSLGYFTGYRSVFDNDPKLHLTYLRRNDSLLTITSKHEEVEILKRFSEGYYTVTLNQDTLSFSDLRFGQVAGWKNETAPCIFQYILIPEAENHTALQRGRAEEINAESMAALWSRIKGKQTE